MDMILFVAANGVFTLLPEVITNRHFGAFSYPEHGCRQAPMRSPCMYNAHKIASSTDSPNPILNPTDLAWIMRHTSTCRWIPEAFYDRVPPELSGAPHFRRSIPLPKIDVSKYQIASRLIISWPKFNRRHFFKQYCYCDEFGSRNPVIQKTAEQKCATFMVERVSCP